MPRPHTIVVFAHHQPHNNPTFDAMLRPPTDPSHCAAVEVMAEVPSHSTLEVAWVFPTPDGEVVLVANRTVASYAPLAPHSPASGQTVVARHGAMAEGSSREVAGLGRGALAAPRHRRVDHLRLVLHAAPHLPEAPGAPA